MSTGRRRLLLLLCALAFVVAPVFASPTRALAADDMYEPDDTLAQAQQIPTDGTTQAHWFEGQRVDYQGVDWLYFEAQAGEIYNLKTVRGTVWSLPHPTFHYADGTGIQDESGYGASEWYFYADHDGPVYIQLLQTSYGETGSYFVSLKGGTPSELGLADGYEPDNTIRSAKDIPVDGTVQRKISDLDIDLVRFAVRKDMVYRVDVAWESASQYMLASVVETSGVVVLGEDFVDRGGRVRYFTANSDGVLYLKCRMGYGSAPYLASITELERSVLAGRVTKAVGGEPVAGAQVRIYNSDLGGYHYGNSSTMITAGPDGSWSLPVQPGAYVALFEDPLGVLLGEYFGGALPQSDIASPIVVGEQETIAAIDGRLWSIADIDGAVALEDGTRISGSVVTLDYLEPGSWSWWKTIGTQTSDEGGRFSFTGLDPRLAYRLTATPVGAHIPDAPIGASLLTGGSTQVTMLLHSPGSISGTVTDESRGVPAEGIKVEVWAGYGGPGNLSQSAVTDANGHYRVSGLASGSYRLRFVDPSGPAGPYGEDFWGASEYGWEDLIPVAIGQETADIDYQLRDALPPITTIPATLEWQRGPVLVELSAIDQGWMGVDSTWFRSPLTLVPQLYLQPFIVSAEGASTIDCWSQDKTNVDGDRNVEEPKKLTVRIDNSAPTTTANVRTAYDGPAAIILSATDGILSGVATTEWRLDGGSWRSDPIPLITPPGGYVLEFRSVDIAGNVEATKSAAFYVRETTTLVLSGPSAAPRYNGTATLKAQLRSGASGVTGASVVFERWNGSSWQSMGAAAVDQSGEARMTMSGLKRAQRYRVTFNGFATYGSSVSSSFSLNPKVSLARSTSWRTLLKNRTYYAKGFIAPAHSSRDPNRVRIRVYKRSAGGSWRYVRSFTASYSYHSSSKTRYAAPIRLTSSGTWKLVAVHGADSRNATTYGSTDYVRVK